MPAHPSRSFDTSTFHREGWQLFHDVIPAGTIEAVRNFLHRHIDDTLAPALEELGIGRAEELVPAVDALIQRDRAALDTLSTATRQALSGHFSLETRLSRALWDVPMSAALQAIVKSLLQSDTAYMHMPPTARFVLPRNTHAGVPPHQDLSYNQHMTNFVIVWVPLVDIDEDCGGVTIFPGTGAQQVRPVTQEESAFWLDGIPVTGLPSVHCTMRAGSVLAFNKWLVHGSTANRSDRTRISTDFRFFGGQDRSNKHYLDLQTGMVVAPTANPSAHPA